MAAVVFLRRWAMWKPWPAAPSRFFLTKTASARWEKLRAGQRDAAAVNLRRQSMLNAVFHQRLQKDGRDHDVQGLRIKMLVYPQLVTAKTHHLDIKVVVHELNLLAQLHELIVLAQQPAQDLGELYDQLTRAVRIKT